MERHKKIFDYCTQVCDQIRWKKAKSMIFNEIEGHILDQQSAYLDKGMEPEEATQQAILQMGDATLVGQSLDKIHKPKPQWLLLGLVAIFLVLGALTNGYVKDMMDVYNHYHWGFYILAFGVVVLFYHLDFTVFSRFPLAFYGGLIIASILLLAWAGRLYAGYRAVYVAGYGLSLANLSLVFPLGFALFVYAMRGRGWQGFLYSCLAYIPLAVALLSVPTTAGLLLFTVVSGSILWLAVHRQWFGLSRKTGYLLLSGITLVVLVGVGGLALLLLPVQSRLEIFCNPYIDPDGAGYVYRVVREIMAQSQWVGQGHGGELTHYLPNISTDYTITYLVHQLGFFVLPVVFVPFLAFVSFGIHKTWHEKSVLGSLVSWAILGTFLVQGVLYSLDTLGYGLLSSISFPFVSYGNVSLLVNAALVGLMLSVFKTGDVFIDRHISKPQKPSRLTLAQGRLTIDFNHHKCAKGRHYEK